MNNQNIELEVDKLNLNESVWKKISKSSFAEVVKVAIESVLKGVLKKKFGINFSTFLVNVLYIFIRFSFQ